jgi:hypothetical protein
MATYVPATLIAAKALGSGGGAIGTWQKQNSAGAGTFDVYRTMVVDTPTAARTVTIQVGTAATDTTAQRIMDATALVANVQQVFNWWIPVPNSSYFSGFANATDINGAAYGYAYTP